MALRLALLCIVGVVGCRAVGEPAKRREAPATTAPAPRAAPWRFEIGRAYRWADLPRRLVVEIEVLSSSGKGVEVSIKRMQTFHLRTKLEEIYGKIPRASYLTETRMLAHLADIPFVVFGDEPPPEPVNWDRADYDGPWGYGDAERAFTVETDECGAIRSIRRLRSMGRASPSMIHLFAIKDSHLFSPMSLDFPVPDLLAPKDGRSGVLAGKAEGAVSPWGVEVGHVYSWEGSSGLRRVELRVLRRDMPEMSGEIRALIKNTRSLSLPAHGGVACETTSTVEMVGLSAAQLPIALIDDSSLKDMGYHWLTYGGKGGPITWQHDEQQTSWTTTIGESVYTVYGSEQGGIGQIVRQSKDGSSDTVALLPVRRK